MNKVSFVLKYDVKQHEEVDRMICKELDQTLFDTLTNEEKVSYRASFEPNDKGLYDYVVSYIPKETKVNDLLITRYEEYEETEKLYLVTDVNSERISTVNLLKGIKKSIMLKHIGNYRNLGQLSDNLVVSKKI